MVLVPFKTVGKDKQDAKISKSSFKCLILGLLNAQKNPAQGRGEIHYRHMACNFSG